MPKKKSLKTIVVYRFSSMGDVALVLPVLKGVLMANDQLQIVFVTKAQFAVFFENIDRLIVITPKLKTKHKGFFGLYRLAYEIITKYDPVQIFDLHAAIRTKILNFHFKAFGKPVFKYQKGRSEKKELIASKNTSRALKTTTQRYSEVFENAGIKTGKNEGPIFNLSTKHPVLIRFLKSAKNKDGKFHIGIAPFAKHEQKIWPVNHVEKLIQLLNESYSLTIFLFGGGSTERNQLDELSSKFSNCIVASSQISFKEEIKLISELDLMLCMDSANMHLSALAGTPVFSIWGATHPSLGFSPYQFNHDFYIEPQISLPCRPCSVYGNKKCIHNTLKCMEAISPEYVHAKVSNYLNTKITA